MDSSDLPAFKTHYITPDHIDLVNIAEDANNIEFNGVILYCFEDIVIPEHIDSLTIRECEYVDIAGLKLPKCIKSLFIYYNVKVMNLEALTSTVETLIINPDLIFPKHEPIYLPDTLKIICFQGECEDCTILEQLHLPISLEFLMFKSWKNVDLSKLQLNDTLEVMAFDNTPGLNTLGTIFPPTFNRVVMRGHFDLNPKENFPNNVIFE